MFRDFSFLAAARPCSWGMVGGPWPMHTGSGRCSIFAMRTTSDYLPRLASAARRVQGPRSGTFRKLDTVVSELYSCKATTRAWGVHGASSNTRGTAWRSSQSRWWHPLQCSGRATRWSSCTTSSPLPTASAAHDWNCRLVPDRPVSNRGCDRSNPDPNQVRYRPAGDAPIGRTSKCDR